jgi:hypothetical protein
MPFSLLLLLLLLKKRWPLGMDRGNWERMQITVGKEFREIEKESGKVVSWSTGQIHLLFII